MRRKDRNQITVKFLKECGFSLPKIRLALHRLTGITQPEMARMIGVSRQVVTHYVSGRSWQNVEIQEAIAKIWQVEREDLFENGK